MPENVILSTSLVDGGIPISILSKTQSNKEFSVKQAGNNPDLMTRLSILINSSSVVASITLVNLV